MSRPYSSRRSSGPIVRVNGKIRAREVRVVTDDGRQLGVISLAEAIRAAQGAGMDLVEVAPNAKPPVCRIVDFGKFRYEQSKREKEARKHQHATKLKEIQLRPGIDPHDRSTKLGHAIEFLCEEMKVKLSLRFRGREMAHKDIGFQVVEKFIEELAPYGHPDAPSKLAGRSVNVILSPLPRNKRAKPPVSAETQEGMPVSAETTETDQAPSSQEDQSSPPPISDSPSSSFVNNPFTQLNS